MWKSGKLTIVDKQLKSGVENSFRGNFTYQIKMNYFIIVSTKTGDCYE